MHQRVPTPTSPGGTRQQHLHNMRFTYIHAKVIQVMVSSGTSTLLCSTAFSATLKLNTHAYFEAKGLSGKWVARLLMVMFIPLVYDKFEDLPRWLLGTSFVNRYSRQTCHWILTNILISSAWLLLKCIRKYDILLRLYHMFITVHILSLNPRPLYMH